jgi:hypothetical protein
MPNTKINSQLIADLSIETEDIKDGAITTSKITIDADLNLAGKKIVNLADPVNNSDAATKAYVDAHTSNSLPPATNGQTLRYNGTAWVADSNLYNDGTNIGIGTTSPSEKLHVVGNIKLSGDLLIGDGSSGDKTIIANNADTNKPQIRYNDISKKWEFTNDGLTWNSIGSGSGGGSGTPGGTDKQIQFNDNGTFGGTNIYYDKVNDLLEFGTFNDNSFNLNDKLKIKGNILLVDPSNENNRGWLSPNRLQFSNGFSVAHLDFDNDGNLNISSTSYVKIENDAIFLGSPFNNFNKSIYANISTWQSLPFIRYNKSSLKWEYSDDGNTVKNLDSGGGGGTPGGTDKQIQFNDNGTFGGANIYYDKTTGNVGIETPLPSEKLDVEGNIRISGYIKQEFPTSDLSATGMIITITAGENLSAGDVLRIEVDGKFYKAYALSSVGVPAVVLAIENIPANSSGKALRFGYWRDDSKTYDIGKEIYLDTTAGQITQTIPSLTGSQVQILGIAITDHIIEFNPDKTILEIKYKSGSCVNIYSYDIIVNLNKSAGTIYFARDNGHFYGWTGTQLIDFGGDGNSYDILNYGQGSAIIIDDYSNLTSKNPGTICFARDTGHFYGWTGSMLIDFGGDPNLQDPYNVSGENGIIVSTYYSDIINNPNKVNTIYFAMDTKHFYAWTGTILIDLGGD